MQQAHQSQPHKTQFHTWHIGIFSKTTLRTKVNRITQSKEPITDGAPLIYSDRKDGVNPAYDVRTDRFEIALDAFNKIDASRKAKREARAEAAAKAEAEAAAEAEK